MTTVIDTFLANWKQAAKTHYVSAVDTYNGLVAAQNALMEKHNLYAINPKRVLPQEYIDAKAALKEYKEARAKSEMELIFRCVYANNPNNPTETLDSFLENVLNKEVANKKAALISKIKAKAGEIVDADKLYIGSDGNINGYVTGTIKQVRIETILAGGYNVQCLHYRVLVK